MPAAVTGDGEHTIAELIAIENSNPRRGYGHEKVMTLLRPRRSPSSCWSEHGYTLETVLPDGEVFHARADRQPVHRRLGRGRDRHRAQTNRFMVERIASIIGLDIGGIDVIAPTLEPPVKKSAAR